MLRKGSVLPRIRTLAGSKEHSQVLFCVTSGSQLFDLGFLEAVGIFFLYGCWRHVFQYYCIVKLQTMLDKSTRFTKNLSHFPSQSTNSG
jgi:hypothetical protein